MAIAFEEIFQDLSSKDESFSAYAEYFEGRPVERSFKPIFNIADSELTQHGATLSEWTTVGGEPRSYFRKLHWISGALLQIQDLLSLVELESIPKTDRLNELFCRHHCYYEALVHLRSGVVSLLNLNIRAAITMLRPIVEQFCYAVFWEVSQESDGSARYNRWLASGKGKPSFREAMDRIKEVLAEKRPILLKRIELAVAGIRQAYHVLCTWSHTPILDESLRTGGLSNVQGGFGDWLFCIHMYNVTLNAILRLFLYLYPMALFPIDLVRKWGCNIPVGVYLDSCSAAIIQEAVGEKPAQKLRDLLFDDPEVTEKLNHAAQFNGLTDEEIWETWEKSSIKQEGAERPATVGLMGALQKAHIRSLGWAFNYLPRTRIEEELTPEEEQFFKRLYGEDYQRQEP